MIVPTKTQDFRRPEGAGLTFPLHRFEVTLLPVKDLRSSVQRIDDAPEDVWIRDFGIRDFGILDFDVPPAFKCALITKKPLATIRTWEP